MNRPISRQQHGLLDYGYVPLVAAAPNLLGFAVNKTPATLARAIAGGVLATTLMTRAEWGLVKVLPFKAHLAADVVVGALSLGAPWLFGFAKDTRARNAFLGIGVLGLMVDLLTQPTEMPTGADDAPDTGPYALASYASPVEATMLPEA